MLAFGPLKTSANLQSSFGEPIDSQIATSGILDRVLMSKGPILA